MSTSAGRSKLDSRRSVTAHHYVGGCPLLDFTSYLELSLPLLHFFQHRTRV